MPITVNINENFVKYNRTTGYFLLNYSDNIDIDFKSQPTFRTQWQHGTASFRHAQLLHDEPLIQKYIIKMKHIVQVYNVI